MSAPEEEIFLAAVNLLMAGERWDEVVSLIEPRLAEEPLGHELVWKLGWAHFQLGNDADALQHLQRAVEAGPVSAAYFGSLGMTLSRLEEHDAAELWLLRALAIHDTVVSRTGLALAYQRRGLVDVAEAVHREGIRLAPGDAARIEAYADFLRDLGRDEEAARLLGEEASSEPEASVPAS